MDFNKIFKELYNNPKEIRDPDRIINDTLEKFNNTRNRPERRLSDGSSPTPDSDEFYLMVDSAVEGYGRTATNLGYLQFYRSFIKVSNLEDEELLKFISSRSAKDSELLTILAMNLLENYSVEFENRVEKIFEETILLYQTKIHQIKTRQVKSN